MILPAITQLLTPPQLQLAAGGILGTRQTVELDRSNPISDIFIHLDLQFSTAPATAAGGQNGFGGTIASVDALANCLRRVQLQANDGQSTGNVVDISGGGLLELMIQRGEQLSRGTHEALKFLQLGASTTWGANNDKWRLVYHIPMVHQKITENLRTRSLFPAHLLQSPPQLILDFESTANMFLGGAGVISSALCSVTVVRRRMPQALTAAIQKAGGFIKFDIIETPKTVAQSQKQFPFELPLGGQYLDLMFRNYLLSGNVYSRDPLDDTTTFGGESRWRIDIGGSTWHEFRMNQLLSRNEIFSDWPRLSQPVLNGGVFVAATSAGSPTVNLKSVFADPFALPLIGTQGNGAQTAHYQSPGSLYLDFIGENDPMAWELGGLLDANLPLQSGAKALLIGDVTTGQLNIVGHRLYGDLSAFQDQTV